MLLQLAFTSGKYMLLFMHICSCLLPAIEADSDGTWVTMSGWDLRRCHLGDVLCHLPTDADGTYNV